MDWSILRRYSHSLENQRNSVISDILLKTSQIETPDDNKKVYCIPKENIPALRDKIISLNRKGIKLFGDAFIPIKVDKIEQREVIDNNQRPWKFYNITIAGQKIKINGWDIVAYIQHERAENIIKPVNFIEVPKEILGLFRNRDGVCEHCGKNRKRSSTYVVYNEELNQYKQIGSSCLYDFSGGNYSKNVASLFEFLSSLDAEISALEAKKNEDEE